MSQRNELAAALYPHLAADRPAPREMPHQTNPLAARLYPGLVPKPPPPSNPWRDSLLRNLRELNAKHDKKLWARKLSDGAEISAVLFHDSEEHEATAEITVRRAPFEDALATQLAHAIRNALDQGAVEIKVT
jgi:hypothetical protein